MPVSWSLCTIGLILGVSFSEWLEPVLQDVECTFGILKQRYRCTKNKIHISTLYISFCVSLYLLDIS